jgi:hypothetical protein
VVFDLTSLNGDAHGRAFEDVTSVMAMIKQRLSEGQELTDDRSTSLSATAIGQYFER